MDPFVYWDKGKRIVLTSDEMIAMVCPSESEDGLEFDDSDEDPTMNIQDLEPLDSDSDPGINTETDVVLNIPNTTEGHIQVNSPSTPEIPISLEIQNKIPVFNRRNSKKKSGFMEKAKFSFPSRQVPILRK
ncbi:hypothetical protein C0J52_05755 [Blattella germanica]|nr:hypothetical protein C0J52_05755 [Blattella germanica]